MRSRQRDEAPRESPLRRSGTASGKKEKRKKKGKIELLHRERPELIGGFGVPK